MQQRVTTEEFIERARKIHGNKYDYSKVEYINSKTKVCIICPEHGEFWQTPNDHLRGKGCRKCKYENHKKRLTKTNEDFIKDAQRVHNNKYDYSKTIYVDNTKKVCIICPEHGEFWQEANSHIRGCGCPECGKIKYKQRLTSNNNVFIEKAKYIHNNLYDYSNVKYINNKTKVCIICPEHGEFWQTPDKHLRGNGCPKCQKSKLEKYLSNFLSENKICFIEEKTFKWLKNKTNMKLDFYLPEYNSAIECQGIQHFQATSFSSNISTETKIFTFNELIERDELKFKQCKEHGIDVFYFTDQNVPTTFKNKHTYYADLNEMLYDIKYKKDGGIH